MGRWQTAEPEIAPGVSLYWRFHHYRRYLGASEVGSPAEAMHRRIQAEANRLEVAGLSPAARVAAVEDFLEELGVLDTARKWAASLERAQVRAKDRFPTTPAAFRREEDH